MCDTFQIGQKYILYRNIHGFLSSKVPILGCKVCSEIKTIVNDKCQGIHISQEWSQARISYFGNDRNSQQLSLRKKISIHKVSKAHEAASKILEESKNKSVEKELIKLQRDEIEITIRIL